MITVSMYKHNLTTWNEGHTLNTKRQAIANHLTDDKTCATTKQKTEKEKK
jgi:hypothetical protein